MTLEDRIADWLEDPQARAKGMRVGYWLSLAFLIFGYGVIVFKLF